MQTPDSSADLGHNPKANMPKDDAATFTYIRVQEGLSRMMNNSKLYARLLSSFKGWEMANTLIQAIQNGDHQKSAESAHALKGVAANLSLSRLTDVVIRVEQLAKSESDANHLVTELQNTMEKTAEAIQSFLESEELT